MKSDKIIALFLFISMLFVACSPKVDTFGVSPTKESLSLVSPLSPRTTPTLSNKIPTPTKTPLNPTEAVIATKQAIGAKWGEQPDNVSLSQNGNWAAIDDYTISTISNSPEDSIKIVNMEGTKEWTYFCSNIYEDRANTSCNTTFYPAHWSLDGQYFFFFPRPDVDGPYFTQGKGQALYSLKLNTGEFSQVLPKTDIRMYDFAFSPNDLHLVYFKSFTSPIDIIVRELTTGKEIHFTLEKKYYEAGGILWLPNNHQFLLYGATTTLHEEQTESSLYLFDINDNSVHKILSNQPYIYFPLGLVDNNLVEIWKFDTKVFDGDYWYLDLTTRELLPVPVPTPSP